MSFLAIIIALVLVQVWGSGQPVQHDAWFRNWQSRVVGWDIAAGIRLALLILLPTATCAWVMDAIEPVLFGLLWIAAAVLLLLYSLGRGDFHAMMARYRGQCHSGDFEAAYLAASSDFRWRNATSDPGSPQEVHSLVQRALLYEGYQRWFAVLFYFVLLGPAGALAYRLLQLCRENFEPELSARLLYVADWVPARLLAAVFTLAGDFVNSRDQLLQALPDTSRDTGEMLYAVGIAALGPEPGAGEQQDTAFGELACAQNRQLAHLLSRSAVCWVALIALSVLLS